SNGRSRSRRTPPKRWDSFDRLSLDMMREPSGPPAEFRRAWARFAPSSARSVTLDKPRVGGVLGSSAPSLRQWYDSYFPPFHRAKDTPNWRNIAISPGTTIGGEIACLCQLCV